jgi:hypothetical protein
LKFAADNSEQPIRGANPRNGKRLRSDAEIVLRFAVRCGFREARQKIFNLRGMLRQTVKEFHINPVAEGAAKALPVLPVAKPLPLACATAKSVWR